MPTTMDTFTTASILQPVKWPADARQDAMAFAPNLTVAKGTIVGKLTTGGKGTPYNNANNDGSQTAVAIAMYTFKTDANGKVYFSTDSNTPGFLSIPLNEAPVWVAGTFDTTELVGLDAAAVADFIGRYTHDGFLRIP